MNKISILSCLLFLAITAVGAFAQSKDEKTKSAIRNVMENQVEAWNKGDIEGFMQGYWNSPNMRFVSGDNVEKGWQSALDRYKKSYDSKAKMGFLTFSDLNITILSKDAAVVLGNWKLDREVNGKKDNPHGKFTLIFRKFKDGWKIVHDHTS